jgi:hypothetical protein
MLMRMVRVEVGEDVDEVGRLLMRLEVDDEDGEG